MWMLDELLPVIIEFILPTLLLKKRKNLIPTMNEGVTAIDALKPSLISPQ